MEFDTAFQMAASNIRFGPGITREVGLDLNDLQAHFPRNSQLLKRLRTALEAV